ncbi:MAG: phosphatidate cytidylyltransferase [Candidatus Binataceae bacterium]
MLRTRLWTAIVVLPAVLAAIIFLPNNGFSVFIAIVGAWGLYEIAAMTSTGVTAILAILVAGAAPLVLLLMLGDVAGWSLPAAVILNMLLLVGLVAVGGGAPGGTSLIISGALWVGVLFPYLAMLRNLPDGVAGIVFMLLVVIASDSGAYFGGRSFGRIKLAPRVSPHKTAEGAISGLAASVAAGLILRALLTPQWSMSTTAAISAAIAVLAQLGDLAGSAFKRVAGVKDSGWIFPGHGGLLDRTCSLVFAAVFTYYCLR